MHIVIPKEPRGKKKSKKVCFLLHSKRPFFFAVLCLIPTRQSKCRELLHGLGTDTLLITLAQGKIEVQMSRAPAK